MGEYAFNGSPGMDIERIDLFPGVSFGENRDIDFFAWRSRFVDIFELRFALYLFMSDQNVPRINQV